MIIEQDDDGLGVMGAVENLSKIFGCINSAYSAFSTIGSLLGFVQGGGGTAALASAIQALAQAIEAGMQKIVDAVQEQTLQQKWQPYANQLKTWQDDVQVRLGQLSSITQDEAGDVWLEVGGRRVALVDWCQGYEDEDGKSVAGVLDDLGDLVEALAAWVTSGGTGEDSPLTLWDELCAAVIQAEDLKAIGETRFTMMFAWYQSLYSLLSTAVYVRNVALQFYLLTKPGDLSYLNLDSLLKLLGDVSTHGTVWAAFDKMFQSYLSFGVLEDDLVCAIGSGDIDAGVGESFFIHPGTGTSLTALWLEPVSLPADPPQVLTSLRFGFYDIDDQMRVFYLVGLPCQVLAGGGLTPLPEVSSLPANLTATDVMTAVAEGKAILAGDNPHNATNDINIATGYVTEPPATGSDETTNVIVGFSFTAYGNAGVLNLDYAELDLSDPAIPSITPTAYTSHAAGTAGMIVMGAEDANATKVDMRSAGTRSNVPLTNASAYLSGSYLAGVYVRNGWPGYRHSMFQPTSLIPFSPQVPASTVADAPEAATA